ncbi:URC4/urg3 family protein [Hylemonella gracilis]|uniref:URC4/urg3 family protein n=1 Tax=Hylemonella gracilis TaxID=80880 RepID=UPI00030D6069|nr:URC4/urg3 family protein [Hylemonella gracilis]
MTPSQATRSPVHLKDAATAVDPLDQQAADLLRGTDAVRARAHALLARARRGESAWFTVHDDALTQTAALVAEVTRERYPDLKIPYHSRWRHFEAGGVNRAAWLNALLGAAPPAEKARTQIDLALVSVLLDAGAGPDWSYQEAGGGPGGQPAIYARSEGLGVASFHAFMAGLFSSDHDHPLQADAVGLQRVTAETLGAAFQVSERNPLVGLEGRAALLRRLGEVMAANPAVFGPSNPAGATGSTAASARPGGLFDFLVGRNPGELAQQVQAHEILGALLAHLSPIWPAQNRIGDMALGDCWRHPGVHGPGHSHGWMPFHKLSQWLTYSLLEPFEWAGVTVTGLDALTGLPEYRNGGLLLDAGVLRPRASVPPARSWEAGDEFIVEWRALTVALLDELAPRVRDVLGLTAAQMPLACVLEGGTWAAGRVLARRLREGGAPPLNIVSDGTVF